MENHSLVSVVKVHDIYSKEEIMLRVKEVINKVGGMQSFVKNGEKVFIKPNFVGPRSSSTGTTTDFAIIEEVINEVRDVGGIPVLGESPGRREFDPNMVFEVLGVKDFAQKMNVKFVDLEKEGKTTVHVPNGIVFHKLKIPKLIAESDVLISLPKMKTHNWTTVTIALKNLMGILPLAERMKAHFHGLAQGLVDINKAVKQNLVVVDGIIAMEGKGSPLFGEKVKLGVLVAGDNPVAVDRVCCYIMDIDPWKVEHLRLALQQIGMPKLHVVGEKIPNVRRKFRVPCTEKRSAVFLQTLYRVDYVLTNFLRKSASIFPLANMLVGNKLKVDPNRCSGCGFCEKICPIGAITVRSTAKIDSSKCARCQCLRCIEACPNQAIKKRGLLRR